jgi:hypothetical protein
MRIDATLEALYKVKNMTLDELTALFEAVNEKVKSSFDFNTSEKEDFDGLFDTVLADCRYVKRERDDALARQAADDASDPKFAHYGDQTYADVDKGE